ncbi:MAG TPA: DUF1850 domain-containing protein [Burkholderiaceae bacterium]
MLIAACLVVASTVAATIPGEFFTLRRAHSTIGKTVPEEDYRVAGDALVLMNSRIASSGSDASPLPGARLKDGIWHRRENRRLDRLTLTRARSTGDYVWCNHSGCRALAHWLGAPAGAQIVEVRAGAACERLARPPAKAP